MGFLLSSPHSGDWVCSPPHAQGVKIHGTDKSRPSEPMSQKNSAHKDISSNAEVRRASFFPLSLTFLPAQRDGRRRRQRPQVHVVQVYFSKTTETYNSSAFPGGTSLQLSPSGPKGHSRREEEDQTRLGLCSLSLVNKTWKLTTGTWPILHLNHYVFANFPLVLQMTQMPHWRESGGKTRPSR